MMFFLRRQSQMYAFDKNEFTKDKQRNVMLVVPLKGELVYYK